MRARIKKPFVNTCVFKKVIKISLNTAKLLQNVPEVKKCPFWPTFALLGPCKSYKNGMICKISYAWGKSISQGWRRNFPIFCSLKIDGSPEVYLKIMFSKTVGYNSLLPHIALTWWNFIPTKNQTTWNFKWKIDELVPRSINFSFEISGCLVFLVGIDEFHQGILSNRFRF